MKPTLLAIIGKPLAGKDTQADLFVAAHPDAVKISTGHIIRAVREEGETHRFWPLLGPYMEMMERGMKMPDKQILATLGEVIAEQIAEGKKILVIAGSPRSLDQLDGFDAMAKEAGAQLLIVHMEASDEETYWRSATRNEGRVDDTPQVHTVRLEEYRAYGVPMEQRLRQEGRLIEINGMQPVEGVFRQLENSVRSRLLDPEISLPRMALR